MATSFLQTKLKNGEDVQTEFLAAIKSVGRVAEHVCAFLNSDIGGTLICGVTDDGDPVGITRAAAEAEALQLALAKQITPPALFSATVESVDGKELIVVDVSAGADRPYVVQGGVWLRKGKRTTPADAQSLRAMFAAQADQPERWERRLSASMLPEDLNQDEVVRLRDDARKGGRFDFSGSESNDEILDRLAMRRSGGYTQAADVLFSRDPALRHPQCRVQFAVYESDVAGDNYVDFRSFENPLFRVAADVIDALTRINPVRSQFRAGDIERQDSPRYAVYALREAVINALVHRDYSSYSGSVRVSVHPSRIEIWNTGRLPDGLKPEDLSRTHPSILVNPDIAHAFFMRGLMDKVGRGGQRLAEECRRIGAQPPEWRQVQGGVQLTLFAALGQDRVMGELLNDRQRAFVQKVEAGTLLSLAEYHTRFAQAVSDRQARRDLEDLENYRFVRKEGVGRSTAYRRV